MQAPTCPGNLAAISDGKVTAADFSAYTRFVARQKTAPAFEGVDLGTAEKASSPQRSP